MSNLYIRLKASFYNHRKTLLLRSRIGDDAMWIPPRLWVHAAEHQPDGDFSGFTSETLAMLLGCPKHAASILQALEECGFIDPDGRIHGWDEHNGYHRAWSERAKKAANSRWNPDESGSKEKNQKKTKKKEKIEIEQALLTHSSSMLQAFRVRVGSWFGWDENTKWMAGDLKALKTAFKLSTSEEDLALLETYYRSGYQYLKQSPRALLEDWQSEIGKARKHGKNPTGTSNPGQPGRKLNTSELMALKAGVSL